LYNDLILPRIKNNKVENKYDYTYGLQRLVFFSDAVFAIAITLLAFNIKLPEIPKNLIGDLLTKEIIGLLPKFAFYALSFLIIGSFWMTHHKMFQYIKKYDDAFIFLNILSLMFIAAVPIPTSIMGEYIMYKQSLVLYASYMAITSLILGSVRFYASYKKFFEDEKYKLYFTVRSLIATSIFILSIPLIYIISNNASFVWISIFIFQFTWRKIYFSRIERKKSN
jgi:uncharacterized membrane protein